MKQINQEVQDLHKIVDKVKEENKILYTGRDHIYREHVILIAELRSRIKDKERLLQNMLFLCFVLFCFINPLIKITNETFEDLRLEILYRDATGNYFNQAYKMYKICI